METASRARGGWSWSYYERPEHPGGIAITARDLAVLWELFINRYMTTEQLLALFGGSIHRRVTQLFRAGLIDRPQQLGRVLRMREGGGTRPGLLALADAGAATLVAHRRISQRQKSGWSERNRRLSPFSAKVPHELGVVDARTAFRRAVALRPELHFLWGRELSRERNPRALAVPGRDEILYTDDTFAVGRGQAEPCLFFHEFDNDTEPNARKAESELESVAYKLEGYLAYALSKAHIAQFGVANFRVLTTIAGSEPVLEHVVDAAQRVTAGHGVNRFLFTRLQTLKEGDPFSILWRNAARERVRLMV